MTNDLEELIKNADKDTLIKELFRGYSFAIPAIGACHPYNEIKAGKTSPALEHMKKNQPECYKAICDLVEKDKAAEVAASHPKVCIHHVKVGDKYVAKKEFKITESFILVSLGDVFEVVSLESATHLIAFKCEDVPSRMLFSQFCEFVENGSLVKQEQ